MSASERRRPAVSGRPALSTVPTAEDVRCEECGAPVEEEQRYCVLCGAHRRGVPDPAAQYLSRASAQARMAREAAAAAARAGSRRTVRLGTAILIALVPLAGAGGLVAGQAGTGGTGVRTVTVQARTGTTGAAQGGQRPRTHSKTAARKLPAATGNAYVQGQNSLGNSVTVGR